VSLAPSETNLAAAQVLFLRLRPLFSSHVRVPEPLQATLRSAGIPLKPPSTSDPSQLHLASNRAAPRHASGLLTLDAINGEWTFDAAQRRLGPRLRANARMGLFAATLLAAAITNSLLTPILLDSATLQHSRMAPVATLGTDSAILAGAYSAPSLKQLAARCTLWCRCA
jgi:hypothetical protein